MTADAKKRGRPSKADILARAAAEAREAGANRAEQGDDLAAEVPTALASLIAPVTAHVGGTLRDFIASLEGARADAVLTHVSHPAATVGIHDGRFSGIRTAPGPLRAVWSDGQITQPDAARLAAALDEDQPGAPESGADEPVTTTNV